MAAPDLRAAVRHGAAHLERMAEELAELEHAGHAAGTDYAELQHRFDILGGYTLDQRVDEALCGLGFARDEWLRPPTALSGGQQTRAALARLVISDPDLMLLDEPTNHLDIGAIEWLEEHLRRRSGALLVASHDRAFLDATVTRIWELRDRRLTVVPRRLLRLPPPARSSATSGPSARPSSHDDAIAREVELVQRYRSQRKHVKMHEHEARLEKLKARGAARRPRSRGARSGSTAPRSRAAPSGRASSWSGSRTSRSGTCRVAARSRRTAPTPPGPSPSRRRRSSRRSAGERIGIVGPNGAGKTTLLRTIAGDLPPLDGIVDLRPPGLTLATSPSCATPRSPAPRSSTRSSRRSRSRRARRAAISPGSCSAATTSSRRSACSRAASARGSSSRCSGSCRPT